MFTITKKNVSHKRVSLGLFLWIFIMLMWKTCNKYRHYLFKTGRPRSRLSDSHLSQCLRNELDNREYHFGLYVLRRKSHRRKAYL